MTDEQKIRELVARWHHATAAGDLPRILALTILRQEPDGRGVLFRDANMLTMK